MVRAQLHVVVYGNICVCVHTRFTQDCIMAASNYFFSFINAIKYFLYEV